MPVVRRAVELIACLLFAACGGDNGACLAELPADCAPLYSPQTFDEIHRRTFLPTCAVAGGGCHAADGAMGGLVFDTPDSSYARVLSRLVPGDPECSLLVKRIESTNLASPGGVMPPGAPLSAAERCVIEKWIASGAAR